MIFSILATPWRTVDWSRLPVSLPISSKGRLSCLRSRYIRTCLAKAKEARLAGPRRSSAGTLKYLQTAEKIAEAVGLLREAWPFLWIAPFISFFVYFSMG